MRSRIIPVTVLVFAACGIGQLQPAEPDPVVSPGTVTFRLLLPSGQSYCDQLQVCGGTPADHFSFARTSGESLSHWTSWCEPECSSGCVPVACPLRLTVPCNEVPPGTPVTGPIEESWDGSYYEQSTCSGGGACFNPKFVRPGRYIASMCATLGTPTQADESPPTCTATGPRECVQVSFDIPGPPVEASLPIVDVDPPPPAI